jgi:hypothetical protein
MTPFNWTTFLENGGSTLFHTAGGTHLVHYTVSQPTNNTPTNTHHQKKKTLETSDIKKGFAFTYSQVTLLL